MTGSSQSPTYGSDWLLGAFKQNPEGLLLLAAGAVLLMRSGGSRAGFAGPGSTSALQDTAAAAKGYVADVADHATSAVSSAAESISQYANKAGRTVSDQSGRVVRQASSTIQDSVSRIIKDQPLMVAFAGIAAGVAIASLFPPSNFEKEALAPLAERLTKAAGDVGQNLKQAAQNAGETLKSAAEERGLDADGLKQVASKVASSFTDSVGGAKDAQRPTKPDVARQDR